MCLLQGQFGSDSIHLGLLKPSESVFMTVQQPLEKVDGGAPGKSSQQQARVTPPNAQQPEPNVQHSSLQRQPSQKLAIKWPPPSTSSQADALPRQPSKEFPAAGHKEVNILSSRSTSGRLSEGHKEVNFLFSRSTSGRLSEGHKEINILSSRSISGRLSEGHKEVNFLFSRSTSGRLSEGQGGESSKTPSSGSDGQVKSAGNGHANPGPTSNLGKPDISQNTSVSKANQTQEAALAPGIAQNKTAAVSKPDGATSWPPQPMGVRSHAVPPQHAASHVLSDRGIGPKQPLLDAARSANGWSLEKANGKATHQHEGLKASPFQLEPEEVKALGEQPSIVHLPSQKPEVEAGPVPDVF